MELLVSKVPTNPTSFLSESCEKDIKRGVSADLFTKGELDQKYGKGRRLATEHFEISQGVGDSRAIDDGTKFWHASGAAYSKTFDLCTAVVRLFNPERRESCSLTV